MSALLELQDFSVYVSQNQPLVKNISLKIDPSEIVGLMGESGSGKTSLALGLLGFKKWTGKFRFKSEWINQQSSSNLRGSKIAMIFQEPLLALNPSLRCSEQVSQVFRTHQKNFTDEEIQIQTQNIFENLGLKPFSSTERLYPHQMSGGMRQRVLIAMAIASNADLIIADEPSSALDSKTQMECLTLLSKHIKSHCKSLLMIHHDAEIIHQFCGRAFALKNGHLDPLKKQADRNRSPQSSVFTKPSPDTLLMRIRDIQIKKYGESKSLISQIDIHENEVIRIEGMSGTGKTSVLRLIAGLDSVAAAQSMEKTKLLTTRPQLIFQDPGSALNPKLKISEQFPFGFGGDPATLLTKVGLPTDLLNRYPSQLSGGQKQRICVARALATGTKILLCDEVTSALDAGSRSFIFDLLKSLHQDQGLTLVIVSHDPLPSDLKIHQSLMLENMFADSPKA